MKLIKAIPVNIKVLLLLLVSVLLTSHFGITGWARSQEGLYHNYPIIMLQSKPYREGELGPFSKQGLLLCGTSGGHSYLTPGAVSSMKSTPGAAGNEKTPIFKGCSESQKEQPWFFFAGNPPHLSTGEVITVQRPNVDDSIWDIPIMNAMDEMTFYRDKGSSITKTFLLNNQPYTLQYRFTKPYTYKVTLKANGREQVIISRFNTAYGYAGVEWAGDLDKDGKLDLIVNFSDGGDYGKRYEYFSNSVTVLFLSSFAKEGDLVAPVARHVASTGC